MKDQEKEAEELNLPFEFWIPAFNRRKNMDIFMSTEHMHDLTEQISLPVLQDHFQGSELA